MKSYASEIDYDLIMNRLLDYEIFSNNKKNIIKKFELTVVPIVIYRYIYRYCTSTGHYRGIVMAGYVTM